MPEIHKKKFKLSRLLLVISLAVVSFSLVIKYFLQDTNIALFNPKGLIAQEQYNLMIFTIVVLFAIVVPTLFVAYFIAWKYRDTNTKNKHHTTGNRSKFAVMGMWLIPTAVILVLASAMLPATQRLAPQETISANAKPLTIQVVAMRWKWLFIYPEQGIATVNFVQVPVNTPVTFELTADETPMSSFWIPNLGGQLYAMTGHVNSLNLMAETPGDYPGSTPEINGRGFAGMKFTARASSLEDFDQWVKVVQQSPDTLDTKAYEKLVRPSEKNPIAFFSTHQNNLYYNVVMKYAGPEEEHGGDHH